MQRLAMLFTAGALALACFAAQAQAQSPARVRGTVTAFDGRILSLNTREGSEVKIRLADNFAVAAAKSISLADVTVARREADGSLSAARVTVSKDGVRPAN